MESSFHINHVNKNFTGITTFPVSTSLFKITDDITIDTYIWLKLSKEEIINYAFNFHSKGNLSEAVKYYQEFLAQGFKDHIVFSNYGLILKSLGKLEDAEELQRKAIELKPDFAEGYSNLGNILRNLGNLEEAENFTRKATEIKPDFANAHSNLGNILREVGRLHEAEISAKKAIELKPNFAQAHCNFGDILRDLGDLKQAEKSYRRAIKLQHDIAHAHFNLGNVLRDLGNLEEAELSLMEATKIKPDFPEAFSNLGNIFKDLGRLEEAEQSTRKAIELRTDYADAYSNLGNILRDLGRLHEAELLTRKAIKLNPFYAEAYSNLGVILNDFGNVEEAELSQRKAIELKPDFAEAYSNLGNILRDLGNLEEAEMSSIKAINLQPDFKDAYFNLSYIQLLKGDYESGLINYEYRNKRNKYLNIHAKPNIRKFDDKKLNKDEKLLVISEQGLGDTLQFMRYIPLIRKEGIDVSFCAQTKLHSLIRTSGIDYNPLTSYEVNKVIEGQWIPLISLLKYLKVNPKNPIINNPYIFSTDEFVNKWNNILKQEESLIIGINWQGNPISEKGSQKGRSFPLESFSIIAKNRDFKFVSLQKGFGSEQVESCSFKNQFVRCQSEIDSTWDFLENAAIIENCDLIITSDTSVAHLAGGMGKPTWLLLKNVPEWRWGITGDISFWYPSMKLFRQKERCNWLEVMERVSDELKLKIGK